jgi:hypothetical protein
MRATAGQRVAAGLAVLVPALAAGGLVLAGTQPEQAPAERLAGDPARIAGAAERPALIPLSGVREEDLQPISGGIRPAAPVQISIPSAQLEAGVEPVGLRDESLEVPDVGRAGWFSAGPRPGEPGRAVIIGHLDRRNGPGLFARVPSLDPGMRIAVTDARGEVHDYEVVGGAQVPKDDFPAEQVFGGAGRPVLVLITCGGDYEPGEGYSDNVLLYARAA